MVSRSSTEAKYRALVDSTCELIWLRWLLDDMDAPQPTAIPLCCDNRSTIYIAHNDVFYERTKHIEIDCHITRQHLKKGNLKLFSISSADQSIDIFTKSHSPSRLRDLISKLQLASSLSPQVWGGMLMYSLDYISPLGLAQYTVLVIYSYYLYCTYS